MSDFHQNVILSSFFQMLYNSKILQPLPVFLPKLQKIYVKFFRNTLQSYLINIRLATVSIQFNTALYMLHSYTPITCSFFENKNYLANIYFKNLECKIYRKDYSEIILPKDPSSLVSHSYLATTSIPLLLCISCMVVFSNTSQVPFLSSPMSSPY